MKRIILVDGNSLMFRAYFATAYTGNLMKNKNGLYTNAIYGFCSMILKLQEMEMSNIFIAFDAGSQTFRHQQLESYKGTRKEIPQELLMQIPYIRQYLDILNIKSMSSLEYEADDFLATVARVAVKEGFDEVKIVTGDKDLLQMVSPKIDVCITRRGVTELEEYNIENFYEKMNIYPSQIPDYKGLVGDTSDNLPGIKGIGDKTATKLLNQFKTLEDIIANASLVKGKAGELIAEGHRIGLECKQLATLKEDIELDFTLEETQVQDFNHDELVSFYKEMGFNSFLEKIDSNTLENNNPKIKIIDGDYDFSKFKDITISVEVFGNNYFNGEFLGIGVYSQKNAFFITEKGINLSFINMLNDETVTKHIFDYKKAYVVLKKYGISLTGVVFDGMLASYIVDPGKTNEDLKKVADEYIISSANYDDLIYGSKSKAAIPEKDIYTNHAISKCITLNKLEPVLIKHLKANEQLELFKMELSLSPVLGQMEIKGLKVDRTKLEEVGKILTIKQDSIAEEIYLLAGEEFNINSVKQLGDILFNKLELPTGKKGKTGYSTNSDVLEKLIPKHPIAQLILDYRGVAKIISTYIKGLFEVMNEKNFVHPLYKQALTMTGRLSSVEPNIQNMPIRTELGQVIREAFVSRFEGGLIMSSDYSQIELRVLAHLSNDEKMIAMFNDKVDFHKQTAMLLNEVDISEVTSNMRRTAKAINFGIIYGMSAWGLSEAIHSSQTEAKTYIEKYFATFTGVKSFLDQTIEDAKTKGYTTTLYNRRRYIPELTSSNKALNGFGERTAMNSPIQGTAADIIKIAMIEVSKQMKGMKSIMVAQVHDELLFDIYPGELEKMQAIVKSSMEQVAKLKVPLTVGMSSGVNWLQA